MELESISFWQARIKELEFETSRNHAYASRLEKAKKRFSNFINGINENEMSSPILRVKTNYSRKYIKRWNIQN